MRRIELIATYCALRTKAGELRELLSEGMSFPGPAKDVENEKRIWGAARPGLDRAEGLAERIADRLKTALTDEEYAFARYCIENGHEPYDVDEAEMRRNRRPNTETPYLGD